MIHKLHNKGNTNLLWYKALICVIINIIKYIMHYLLTVSFIRYCSKYAVINVGL